MASDIYMYTLCYSEGIYNGEFSLYLYVVTGCEIFSGLSVDQEVLLTHRDSVEELAECCHAIAHSGSLIAAIQHNSLQIYGLQFHPEVDLTDNGADMMRNFLYNVMC